MQSLMRRILRRVSRNRTLRKRLPADLGSGEVVCSPEALLSVWKPGFRSGQAQGLFRWARTHVKPGMCVWDLGANQGLFSFAASALAGPEGMVVAFEPDLFLVDLLRRSIATGSHTGAPVHILPIAVDADNRLAQFEIAGTDRALNHLVSAKGNPRAGNAREVAIVACASLDWLARQLRAPDLLKVDVEGAELAVLRGGMELMRSRRPRFILETAPENADSIAEIMRNHDYLMYDVNDEGRKILARPAWNTLAIPAERND